MQPHPIENIMQTTLENIKDMIDVNTIVGEAITTVDGQTILPISKVSFGFVAGGGEYELPHKSASQPMGAEGARPFAGGAGAGVSVSPVAFLVIGKDNVRLLCTDVNTPYDRIIELIPQIVTEVRNMFPCRNDAKHAPAGEGNVKRQTTTTVIETPVGDVSDQ
nr:GerW family sporulation protein [Maliibacterium massiliense]